MRYVVLKVYEGEPGVMATYGPQVASVHDYHSKERAACANVGSHPDYDKRGRPYRVVVVPLEHWHEFDVYSESVRGSRYFRAYPADNPTLRPPQ